MRIEKTHISGLLVLQPQILEDKRGYFFESYRNDVLSEALGFNIRFCQENEAYSSKGVLRGLHFQIPPKAQSKYIRVVSGAIMDAVVDIRRGSVTYGQHYSIELTAANKKQLFVPRGFAHGYLVLSDEAVIQYKVDEYYSAPHDRGLYFADSDLNIDWHYPEDNMIVSPKDQKQPRFSELQNHFHD